MKNVWSSFKKAVAFVVCGCLICSVFVMPACAKGSDEGSESFVTSLLKSTRTVCLNKLVSWTLDGFMNAMFEPEESEETKRLKDIQEQIGTVLANQQKINDELKSLEGLVEVQSYLEIINNYMDALTLCEPFFQCYDTLNNIDKTYAGQPEALKIERLRALTDGLGVSSINSASTSVDDKFLNLYNKFVGPISYTVNKQVISDGDLLDVYREIKRYQYCFENEAWDEMEAFFEYAAYSFAVVSLVESASVQARIERCRLHNEGKQITDPDYYSTASLETWLYNQGGTAAETDLESRIGKGNAVYEEHQVVRQDVFRHFWKPGYEVLLYSNITNLGNHPVNEPLAGKGGTSAGLNFKYTEGMRVKSEGENAKPVDAFWDAFYKSDLYPDKQLISTEIVNQMLTACGHNSTLAEILRSGDFIYHNGNGVEDSIGLVLRKDDSLNPFKITQSHDTYWMEGLGSVYTDNIRVYPRFAPLSGMNDIAKNKAADYGTYRYYHTSNGKTKWYVENNYTAGALAQLYVCEDTCFHGHLHWVEGSAVTPTCTSEGKEADFECLDCGKVFVGKTLPKAPHTGGTWQKTASKHWKICDVCGEEYDAGPHKSTDSLVLLTGLYICDDCGYITNVSPLMSGKTITKPGGKDPVKEPLSEEPKTEEPKTEKSVDTSAPDTGDGRDGTLALTLLVLSAAVMGAGLVLGKKKPAEN